MKTMFIFLLPIMLFAASCKTGPEELTPGPSTPREGYASGIVTDSQGNPMSGVKVYVDNTIFYNSGISTTSDTNGNYNVKTPQGSWKVYAEMERTFNGTTYKIDLHPDSYESFPGVDGAVRNFTWELTGERPSNPGTFYGGLVKLYKDPDSDIYDMENVEFTFTPVGALIDGSQGEVIVRKCGAPRTDFYSLIHDIPIGLYKITATYLPTGQSLKLRNDYFLDQPYEAEPEIDFFGISSGANCTDCMYVAYTEK